ncbi:hypothetical protein Halha_2190 [Halobacteroides halobius DSM 5150]|uniref:Uncharacterized protein n=1 Tax=Halobacteroides halobius (strain ATCC 35273 / DSM 5150 / MD-1) TaxID=748449 RepID=L0KBZ0_HALHC|nr:hypothetical protein [Halobacteroides halobius]AGB42070.1 hypothetical protein Halha_2190 [Halobacteroides halobius DSM 5150]
MQQNKKVNLASGFPIRIGKFKCLCGAEELGLDTFSAVVEI